MKPALKQPSCVRNNTTALCWEQWWALKYHIFLVEKLVPARPGTPKVMQFLAATGGKPASDFKASKWLWCPLWNITPCSIGQEFRLNVLYSVLSWKPMLKPPGTTTLFHHVLKQHAKIASALKQFLLKGVLLNHNVIFILGEIYVNPLLSLVKTLRAMSWLIIVIH